MLLFAVVLFAVLGAVLLINGIWRDLPDSHRIALYAGAVVAFYTAAVLLMVMAGLS